MALLRVLKAMWVSCRAEHPVERPLPMAPKLYASKRCRSDRVMWLAKELDIPLDVEDLKETQFKSPDYLKINPLGQVGGLTTIPHPC